MQFIIIILLSNIKGNIVGEYNLVGLSIMNSDFCRDTTDIIVTEKSGFDNNPLTVYTLQPGDLLDYSGEEYLDYPYIALLAAGVNLQVYFANDGTATILEGSTYPTESAGDGCITEEQTLPIQEDFAYVINSNSNISIPMIDILGFESVSPYKGLSASNISITGSDVFDHVPIIPAELTIPFNIDTSQVFNNGNEIIAANDTLPGMTGGYIIKSTEMYSFIDYLEYDPNGFYYNEDNPPNRPSLYLEWHAIDGPINESGLGDVIGEDEDGDGTDFDKIYGLEKIKITKVYSNTTCGSNNYDIAGNHIENLRTVKYNQCLNEGDDESACILNADDWINNCIDFEDTEDVGNNLYVIDLSQDTNFNWGGYITWNSIIYQQTQDPNNLVDDSNEDFNSSCMDDGDYSDCSGRILFEYTPQCIPSFNMRYFMAELEEQCQEVDKDECGVCFGNGIPDGYCDCFFPIEGDLQTYCFDPDGDGFGNQTISQQHCSSDLPEHITADGGVWTLDCSSLNNENQNIPNVFNILNTYPNPFNPNLNIEFDIKEASNVKINIYDINGKLVHKLIEEYHFPGQYKIDWNAKNFSSGVYFIKLELNAETIINTVKLIK